MAAVNRSMFEAGVIAEAPSMVEGGASLMVLPLNLVALIVTYVDDAGDLARLCRTCRVLNYMALPHLYKTVTLASYDKIRYRNDVPEGWGSASPFSMGLDALITRPVASMVRSLTLRGEWREPELEEHSRVGRVPDSSMMLNIAVRAAVDRTRELESFSWELNTKMLETVYLGLSQLRRLTSLSIRFPSSRHPRPTIVIPPMPHLRRLKVTDIDPLCYPDDISTLLLMSRKLDELKMHWSPRMRNAQEPSVILYDYFRKCLAANQPMVVKTVSFQNLYAIHRDEIEKAIDHNAIEELSMLSSPGADELNFMNTFVDRSWPDNPPHEGFCLKALRHDAVFQRVCDFIGKSTGIERLYVVNGGRDSNSPANFPQQATGSGSPSNNVPTVNNNNSDNDNNNNTNNYPAAAPPSATNSPATSASFVSLQINLRDNYLNNVITNHSATLRHLLLPSRWSLPKATIVRLVHACPQLEQLGFATDISSMETLALLLPFLRKLRALRLLIPTSTPATTTSSSSSNTPSSQQAESITGTMQRPSSPCAIDGSNPLASVQSVADMVELDDEILMDKMSMVFADRNLSGNLRIVGAGWKAWELREFYTVPADCSESQSVVAGDIRDGLRDRGYYSSGSSSSNSSNMKKNGVANGYTTTHSESRVDNNRNSQKNSTHTITSTAGSITSKTSLKPRPPPSNQTPPQPASLLGKRTRGYESTPAAAANGNGNGNPTRTPPTLDQQQEEEEDEDTRKGKASKSPKTFSFPTTTPTTTTTTTTTNSINNTNNENNNEKNQCFPTCIPPTIYCSESSDGRRVWRRRLRRVGWEFLRNWEIWGLDSQEL